VHAPFLSPLQEPARNHHLPSLDDSSPSTLHHPTILLLTPIVCHALELTAGLKVISIAGTPDLRDWGTLLGPLGTLMSLWLAG
jgi:hypothetical protein